MNEKIKTKASKLNLSKKNLKEMPNEVTYLNYYSVDVKYKLLSPIMKDIQICSQLIKFIKKHQISDLIFIKGNNSYSIESRFYFNYRNIIDFYIKVLDFIETDYFTQVKYYVYKTKPSSKEFIVNLTIFYNDENSSKISIEIILFNYSTLNKKILNIIFNEFNLNFTYLSQAIKSNKLQSFAFCSSIVKNEFFVLTQIIQNVKLIEYIINGQFKKYQKEKDSHDKQSNSNNININILDNTDKDKSFIHVNENYLVILKKKKDINDWLNTNNISFKIQLIKIREDNMIIQYKVILNNKESNTLNDINSIYNIVTICIRKLTTNSSFIFIKCIWDFSLDENLINSIKNFNEKCLHNIEKLSKTSKQY
jgi:hypothetical protein